MAEGGYYVNDGNQQQQRQIIKEKHVLKKTGDKTEQIHIITYDDGSKKEEYSTEVKSSPDRRRNKLFKKFPLGWKLSKSEHPPAKAAAVTLQSAFTVPSPLPPPPRLPPRNNISTSPKIIDSESPEEQIYDGVYDFIDINYAKEDKIKKDNVKPALKSSTSEPAFLQTHTSDLAEEVNPELEIYDDCGTGIPKRSPPGTPPNDKTNPHPHHLKTADLDTSKKIKERRNSLPLELLPMPRVPMPVPPKWPRKNTCKDKTSIRPVSAPDLKSSDRLETDTNEDKDAAYDYLEAMRNNLKRMCIIKEVDDSHSYDTTPDMLYEIENLKLAKEEPLSMDMTETNDGQYENVRTYETPELGPDQEVYV